MTPSLPNAGDASIRGTSRARKSSNWVMEGLGAPRAREVARLRHRLHPALPGDTDPVQLMEEVVDILVAGGRGPIELLATRELPRHHPDVVGLREVSQGEVAGEPGRLR